VTKSVVILTCYYYLPPQFDHHHHTFTITTLSQLPTQPSPMSSIGICYNTNAAAVYFIKIIATDYIIPSLQWMERMTGMDLGTMWFEIRYVFIMFFEKMEINPCSNA